MLGLKGAWLPVKLIEGAWNYTKTVNAVVAATDMRNHKDDAIAVAMNHVGYLGRRRLKATMKCARGTPTILTKPLSLIVSSGLKSERFPTVKLNDFADLSFLTYTAKPTAMTGTSITATHLSQSVPNQG
jgi:hypothetical protein